jgi:hypothetical protein
MNAAIINLTKKSNRVTVTVGKGRNEFTATFDYDAFAVVPSAYVYIRATPKSRDLAVNGHAANITADGFSYVTSDAAQALVQQAIEALAKGA